MFRTVYDVCVVGAGVIGSAAARHATNLVEDKRILLIGPSEPKDRSSTDLFAAHYDEGRLTRQAPPDALWGLMTQRSIERYRDIENSSGISFFDECGFLQIGLDDDASMNKSRKVAQHPQIKLRNGDYNAVEAGKKFPYIHFRTGEVGLYSEKSSGNINPRKLVQAQLTLAERNGCTVVDDSVISILPPTRDDGLYEILTGRGHSYLARNVLLATGAFTCSRDLLPRDKIPDITNLKKTVILVEISEEEYEAKLTTMPTMIVYRMSPNDKREKKYWTYIMKPIRYPDGKLYIKLGGWGDKKAPEANTSQELSDWYRIRGDPVIAKELMTIWRDVFPGLKPVNVVMDGCVTSHTPNERPYIDMVQPGLGVAIGGCARGAMSSDELGRIAARMMLNKSWEEDDYPRDEFRYRVKPTTVESKL